MRDLRWLSFAGCMPPEFPYLQRGFTSPKGPSLAPFRVAGAQMAYGKLRWMTVTDSQTEHVSEVLVQAGKSDFFVARDVRPLLRGGEMSAGFQRRAAGDDQIVSEVAIRTLPETFSDVARYLSR